MLFCKNLATYNLIFWLMWFTFSTEAAAGRYRGITGKILVEGVVQDTGKVGHFSGLNSSAVFWVFNKTSTYILKITPKKMTFRGKDVKGGFGVPETLYVDTDKKIPPGAKILVELEIKPLWNGWNSLKVSSPQKQSRVVGQKYYTKIID